LFRRFPEIAMLTRPTAFLAALIGINACASVGTRSAGDVVAITGVTIIDPTSSNPSAEDQTILVSSGVIQAVGPSTSTAVPAGARRIDARGKFAIPGLWDAHVHFMNTGPTALSLYIANGVTSVREMGGYIDSTRAWQARMKAGSLVGPRILTPGPILESPVYLERVVQRSVADPRIGRRVLPYRLGVTDSIHAGTVIDSLVRLRVDFVKVRTSSNPAAFYAILREAKRAGLRVAAHQSAAVSIRNALDSGQTDLQHGILPPLSTLSPATRDSVYRKFVENNAWYTPTLSVSRTVMLSGDSAARAIFGPDVIRADERRAYASPWLLEWWRMQVDERIRDPQPMSPAVMDAAYASSVADVRRMHELGVEILAGTDAGSVLVYPGFALHDELRLLVDDAGLSPRAALWSATVGPARFARLDDRLGTLSAGKIADVVLLDADPLTDIRNTRRINAVIQAGRVFPRAELDALLSQVRATVAQ
jgi:imidazolonepropionase-like amidohydrolase